MRLRLKAMHALAALLLSGGASAGEVVRLAPGAPQIVSVEAGGTPAVLAFDATPGDYVRGRLEVKSGGFDLDVLDSEGRPSRRLLDGVGLSGDFQFIAGPDLSSLRLTGGPEGGKGQLTLTMRLPLADQRAPDEGYESPLMAEVAATLARGGDTGAFWKAVSTSGTPLVETAEDGATLLTFAYRGAKRNVRLVGAPSGDHEWLDRLGNSDIWFKTFHVPPEARFSYQLAPDVPDLPGSARDRRVALLATAQADPLNRAPWPADASDRFNTKSTVTLAAAPLQPGLDEAATPTGRFETFRFSSERLGNSRDVTIYRPAGFDPADPEAVMLVVFDGRSYQREVPTPAILDALIRDERLPSTLAVFISNPDQAARSRELPDNATFADVLADDLLPVAKEKAGFSPPPARIVLAGSSFGGLASATIALRRPDAFGNALSMSGSFWWSPPGTPSALANHVADRVAHELLKPVRFFLSAGLFERQHDGVGGILETNRHLRDVLIARGYDVTAREYAGGHDNFVWRGAIADGLLALFGRPAAASPAERIP